jgi:4-carboxymuconolactone decarboxylase
VSVNRIQAATPAQLSARQQVTYDRIAAGPRGAVRGPFEAWILAPELADHAEALGNYLRFGGGLPDRLNELAILLVAEHWRSTFVWMSHKPLALQAGISEPATEAIRSGRDPHFNDPDCRAAFTLITELLETKSTSDATWTLARQTLGDDGTVNLIGIAGYYGLVCMTINAYHIGGPPIDIFTA